MEARVVKYEGLMVRVSSSNVADDQRVMMDRIPYPAAEKGCLTRLVKCDEQKAVSKIRVGKQ